MTLTELHPPEKAVVIAVILKQSSENNELKDAKAICLESCENYLCFICDINVD